MLKFVALPLLLVVIPVPGSACSAAACLDHGIETTAKFAVVIKYQGKPLRGATVKITQDSAVRFSGVTAANGIVSIGILPPGDYWLDAEFLGITAGYECFHVAERATPRAKRRIAFDWGDLAPATSRIAGALVDSQPGTGESPIWNLIHRVNLPISGARLTLEGPTTREVYRAVSDENGGFAIDDAPPGIYVLHVQGGRSNRDYDATDVLINLSRAAKRTALELTRRDAGGGSCGGTYLELR